jgi:ABC-type amino acid transport substrate-binding protein
MRRILLPALLAFGTLAAAPGLAAPLRLLAYETKPFFFRGAGGEPAGIEYEVLQYLAKTKGQTVQVERELSTHIQQLKASQIYFRILEKHLGAEAARLVAAGKG